MYKSKVLLVLVTLGLTFSLVQVPSLVNAKNMEGGRAWTSYTFDHYDVALEYPEDWVVIAPSEADGTYGGVLTFVLGTQQIVFGLHTLSMDGKTNFDEWLKEYFQKSSTFNSSEFQWELITDAEAPPISGIETYIIRGSSPMTYFQLANLVQGEMVWFLWTNLEVESDVFTQMLKSIKIGENAPTTLSEAFGPEFQPQPRESSVMIESPSTNTLLVIEPLPDNSFYAPIPVGSMNVGCGSSAHVGRAYMAVDIWDPLNTPVHSTHRSWIDFAGWDFTGYGNLLMANTDYLYAKAYLAAYAHLNSFAVSPGQQVWTSTNLGLSGNTGTSTGPHLHFHIRTSENPVDLGELRTFNENEWYPSNDGESHYCGYMTR